MLTIDNLTVRYGAMPVLENLDLGLEPGCIHGLVGMNGSGKTTLFYAIYGLIKPDSGNISRNGKPVSRKDIALLATQNYFYSGIRGREYLDLFPSPAASFDPDMWQELFKLPLDELIENYSTGMKKKLALTGILKLDKPVLLLDEPFNGVDLETGRIMKLLLEKLKEKNKTIIITSHVLETLTSSCDYIHYLENKRIRKTYRRDELSHVEQELFGEMEDKIQEKIGHALSGMRDDEKM